jgi:hypothetical protein
MISIDQAIQELRDGFELFSQTVDGFIDALALVGADEFKNKHFDRITEIQNAIQSVNDYKASTALA